jgi:signal transduction histidine kinase
MWRLRLGTELMRIHRANAATAKAWLHGLSAMAVGLLLMQPPRTCCASGTESPRNRLVVVLYPESYNGSPGNALADQGIRSVFANQSPERIEIHNEYLEVSRFPDADYQQELSAFLRRKYADRKVDLVIAGLSSAFDFVIHNRKHIFPDAPLVFLAVDEQEIKSRAVEPDVVGAPIRMDLADSLDLALRLHPRTQQVFVIAGKSRFDAYWEAEARRAFRAQDGKVVLKYLSGLPMAELLEQTENLPEYSIAYYLHVFEDGDNQVHMPAEVLGRISAVASVPIYSHVGSYIGSGIVGGRVFSFETAGRRAAEIGLRILAGERPQQIGIQPTIENDFVFDARQLRRWGISEASLPAGSVVRYHEPSIWALYRWHILAVAAFLILQTMLIVRLLMQRRQLAQAKHESHESQRELQGLTGKLLRAQESERRRIASELHDDFGQSLALLSVEIDLLRRKPAESNGQSQSLIDAMSTQVKQLSSAIHDLSHQLHPLKLEQLGLVAALRALCSELTHTLPVRIDFIEQRIPAAIPHPTAVCLYRIVQEALRNVIKHSGARNAVVELRGVAGGICLCIQDDGVGFDPDAASSHGGLGLVSMRERLRAVQGKVLIAAQPTKGTRIEVRVPLGNDPADVALESQPPTIVVVDRNSMQPGILAEEVA